MENLNKGDDKQKCAIVNQFSLCFKEIPDCETEIKGFVRELSSVSQQINVIDKIIHDFNFLRDFLLVVKSQFFAFETSLITLWVTLWVLDLP